MSCAAPANARQADWVKLRHCNYQSSHGLRRNCRDPLRCSVCLTCMMRTGQHKYFDTGTAVIRGLTKPLTMFSRCAVESGEAASSMSRRFTWYEYFCTARHACPLCYANTGLCNRGSKQFRIILQDTYHPLERVCLSI